ncbi:aminotransferase class I/II-fold pyridoxal phosphate-dependent enzyme [Rhizobium sp. S-51]|uniref:GDP-perosamine synthase n=1 Tax=Rhizobium terricola TaxID=2728849 RepID=A0A7Y0AY79_9HYPH|nr:aminotransferase class I/II-fold pyridoxal phosphate-dependent enzyme [Rhizobium terricola]NML75682.1 aminotransferase class I/II-fold pyridoxal phosphate-dependent enzyme [Rhizobium terricola]
MKTDCIAEETTLREALARLDASGRGVLVILSEGGEVRRTVTDGDLRRLILKGASLEDPVRGLPPRVPVTAPQGISRVEALGIMDEYHLDHLPVVDAGNRLVEIFDRKTLSKRIFLSSPHMGDLEREYVDEAFRSNWIAPLGPNVDAFEREICEMIGIKAAAALSSGSAAIHLALRLLGVGSGDRVFCSSLTFIASAAPIVYQDAEPVFIDSEPETWNMSPKALERALAEAKAERKLPKAIVVVNLYGQSADMDPILELADYYGVPVVEDAAESLGAKYKGRNSGTFGRLGVFSFNGNKIITTSGGGMLVSDDSDLIARARFLSTQAREPALHYEHKEIGYNYRMSNILAGIGRGQLKVLDDRIEARRRMFDTYVTELSGIPGIEWMPEPAWSFSNRWLTACTLDPTKSRIDNHTLLKKLADDLIEARPIWKPLHLQPVFKGCSYYQHDNTSVSDSLYDIGLCLPSGSNMTQDDIARVTGKIRSLVG